MQPVTITPLSTLLAVVVVLSGHTLAQDQEVITRGDVLGDSPLVSLHDVMNDVDTYLDTTVTVEGSVNRVCQMKGCWMELAADDDTSGVRVTFKDYGFFVPTDSQGRGRQARGHVRNKRFLESGCRPSHRRGRRADAEPRRYGHRVELRRGGRAAQVRVWMLRKTKTIGVGVIVVMAAVSVVSAHMALKKSMPEEGVVLTTSPDQIQLWFTQEPDPVVSRVSLGGPSGDVEIGETKVTAEKSVVASVPALGLWHVRRELADGR